MRERVGVAESKINLCLLGREGSGGNAWMVKKEVIQCKGKVDVREFDSSWAFNNNLQVDLCLCTNYFSNPASEKYSGRKPQRWPKVWMILS
jgi:hypothetical protein